MLVVVSGVSSWVENVVGSSEVSSVNWVVVSRLYVVEVASEVVSELDPSGADVVDSSSGSVVARVSVDGIVVRSVVVVVPSSLSLELKVASSEMVGVGESVLSSPTLDDVVLTSVVSSAVSVAVMLLSSLSLAVMVGVKVNPSSDVESV